MGQNLRLALGRTSISPFLSPWPSAICWLCDIWVLLLLLGWAVAKVWTILSISASPLMVGACPSSLACPLESTISMSTTLVSYVHHISIVINLSPLSSATSVSFRAVQLRGVVLDLLKQIYLSLVRYCCFCDNRSHGIVAKVSTRKKLLWLFLLVLNAISAKMWPPSTPNVISLSSFREELRWSCAEKRPFPPPRMDWFESHHRLDWIIRSGAEFICPSRHLIYRYLTIELSLMTGDDDEMNVFSRLWKQVKYIIIKTKKFRMKRILKHSDG